MAVTVAELVARLTADTSQFRSGLAQANAQVTQSKAGLDSLGKSALSMGKAFAGAAVLGGVMAAGAAVVQEMRKAEEVTAQTNAVLKSTGGIANVTAKEVQGLASAISAKSGIDDQAVQSAENLLLTFKNVRNEVGRGNDVFNRATKAAVDLSVAGFGDMTSTAKMLGKALNDPIAGITALSRAGVTFTKSQKETIKALTESGKLLQAQKLILREVESQVGGSAEAYGKTLSGALGKAREALLDLGTTVAEAALPAFQDLAAGVSEFAAVVKSVSGEGFGIGGALRFINDSFNPVMLGLARMRALIALTKGDWKDFAIQTAKSMGIVGIAATKIAEELGLIGGNEHEIKFSQEEFDKWAEGADRAAGSTRRSREELEKLRVTAEKILNTQLGLSGALLNVESAQRSYTEAVKEHGTASLEARQAEQSLAEDIVAAGQAAYDTGGLKAQIDTLNFLKSQLDPGSPLRANVEAMIARLSDLAGLNPIVIDILTHGQDQLSAMQAMIASLEGEHRITFIAETLGQLPVGVLTGRG